MSEWPNSPRAQVIPIKGRRANSVQVIRPHVTLSENAEAFEEDLRRLRENNGQHRAGIAKFLDPEATEIQKVTPVYRNDGSPAYLEIRTGLRIKKKAAPVKAFRIIYRANVTGSDNPMDDGVSVLRSGMEELGRHGLYIPTNSAALLEAVRSFKQNMQEGLHPAIMWCEGESARMGLERRLGTEAALEAFAQRGLACVTSATLGGIPGIKHTNYALQPGPNVDPSYTVARKNDETLDLSVAFHYIILDADASGYHEGCALADKLQSVYAVSPKQVFLVDAPAGVPSGWDDADPLPLLVSEEDRIQQILDAPLFEHRWVYKSTKGNDYEIDPDNMKNRRRALRAAGIEECHVDTAVNKTVIRSRIRWENSESPTDSELLALSEQALTIMGHQPVTKLLNIPRWREALDSLAHGNWRDTIHEETMAMVEQGRPLKSDANIPERLFMEMFGLPDTRFNRLAGWHLIRDALALRLRPAFNSDHVVPQLLYVFYGNEGCGKSTAVKVLAGGSPSSVADAPRYTDRLDFRDLSGSDTHGDLQLYHKVAGMTAVELADKSLGVDISRSRADMLKHFANKGVVQFRGMWAATPRTCNLRCVRIFTTNNSDILTPDMGSRRWVIIDTTTTEWPDVATLHALKRPLTEREAVLLERRNPGLDWVHANFPAMIAHMYDSGAWQEHCHPTPEFAALLQDSQTDYVSEENWEVLLSEEVAKFELVEDIGILATQLARYALDMFGTRAPSPQAIGALLRRRRWSNSVKRPGQLKPVRIWHRGDSPKEVQRYAIWAHKDGSSPGRWTVQQSISQEHVETMSKVSSGDPF